MKVLKRLLSRITLYPTVFLAGFICLLLATIFSELSPFLLQKMIDGPLTALTHGGGQGDLLQMGALYLLVLSIGQLISYMGNSKPECRPLGRHILDYPILFKVTQKTTPATFIEWHNMFGNKVANSFFPFFHLTNIDWFIAR